MCGGVCLKIRSHTYKHTANFINYLKGAGEIWEELGTMMGRDVSGKQLGVVFENPERRDPAKGWKGGCVC